MAEEEYKLKEIRPGHFAKLVDGEVVGMASKLEILIAEYQNHIGYDISPGIIEVALAVTSLTAILASLEGVPLWFRLLAFVAFTLSGLALALVMLIYLTPRVPFLQIYYCRLWWGWEWNHFDVPLILISYPILALWFVLSSRRLGRPRGALEFCHATLAAAVFLAGAMAYGYAFQQVLVMGLHSMPE